MKLPPQTQAVLLLTARFARPAAGEPKPLSIAEWDRFTNWLRTRDLTPEILLERDPAHVLSDLKDKDISIERVCFLMNRGAALAFAAEKWERSGICIVTRGSSEYPSRLKKRLGGMSPAVLFGVGNWRGLNHGGIAIVGSRDATHPQLELASLLGARATSEGIPVISGGARGIDESSMLGSLESGGSAIGVMADGLLKASTSKKYREFLRSGQLTLVSPFNPEAGFDVGNAMARNKYVYCLGDAAVIVTTARGSGGTWAGATEALRRAWVPLYVHPSDDVKSGSDDLIALGARKLPELSSLVSLSELWATVQPVPEVEQTPRNDPAESLPIPAPELGLVREPESCVAAKVGKSVQEQQALQAIYGAFLHALHTATDGKAETPTKLRNDLALTKSQMDVWLAQAVKDGYVRKLQRPVRYVWASAGQGRLFG